MRWLVILLVVAGAGVWAFAWTMDHGLGVLDEAVELRAREQARSRPGPVPPPSFVPAPPPPGPPVAPVAAVPVAPTPAPPLPDLRGLTRDAVERLLGSPTGRVRSAREEEWWYDRHVVVFQQGVVIGQR